MSAPMMQSNGRKYLFHFAHDHLDFRIAELSSILSLFNIPVEIPAHDVNDPFMTLELPSEEHAVKIASRSMLIRSVYQLWSRGTCYTQLNDGIRQMGKHFLEPFISSPQTFRFQVISFNKSLTNKDKLKKIESLPHDVLQFEGSVNLKSADNTYSIIEHYGPFGSQPLEEPVDIYFGKWITDGQRDRIREYHLQKRHFIANTSMDAALSMIMANIGKVLPNSFMFDPFVGSGSLLVSAAHFGAYVLGTDIDYLLLHAKARPSRCNEKKRGADESIRANLRQYGLEHRYIDALVADTSKADMWRGHNLFDVIITDPPYGIREGAKKVGTEESDVYIDEELKASGNHFPKRLDYHLSDIFKDLLNFAAQYLNMNGRLVFWFPVSIKDYTEANIPTHPCLRLVHNCEQQLNTRVARRLITMEKVQDYKQETSATAEVAVDHFEDATFREMYFNEDKLQRERTPHVAAKCGEPGDGQRERTPHMAAKCGEPADSQQTVTDTVIAQSRGPAHTEQSRRPAHTEQGHALVENVNKLSIDDT